MNIFKSKTALPLIVNMMAEYIKREEEKSDSFPISIKDIEEKYYKLISLGLGNSTNAKTLENVISSQITYNENITKAKALIAYIKEVNTILDRSSYLVSFEQFKILCKKYNLIYRPIKQYTGVIPEENILQLEKISDKLSNGISKVLNINKDLYFVESVEVRERETAFANWIKDKRILYLPSLVGLKFNNEVWNRDIIIDYPNCPKTEHDAINCVKVKQLSSNDFLIAAPKTHFKDDFKITIRPKDPIVFQICPYGCLIHSVWGEEADDTVLKKYKETLNLL